MNRINSIRLSIVNDLFALRHAGIDLNSRVTSNYAATLNVSVYGRSILERRERSRN